MTTRIALLLAASFVLGSCGGEDAPSAASLAPLMVGPPAAASTPAPTPSPSPTPAPAPVPTTKGDGKIVVVTEGSSTAISWGGSHTGMYGNSRNDIEYHGLAVGGSGISRLFQRLDKVIELKPDLVSIYIGSNDLSSFVNTSAFVVELRRYVDRLHADGARVVICTLLPHQTGTPDDLIYNVMRREFAEIIRSADWVDGVADFAADPVMGPDEAPFDRTLYQADGVHPTDGTHGVGEGGQRKLFRVFQPAMDKLVADIR